MVDAGAEGDLGRLEGVLRGEVDVEEEDAALVRGAGRPEDGRHPLVQVVTLGPRAANTQLYCTFEYQAAHFLCCFLHAKCYEPDTCNLEVGLKLFHPALFAFAWRKCSWTLHFLVTVSVFYPHLSIWSWSQPRQLTHSFLQCQIFYW